MMKRITALLLLISILLGVPVSADTGMPVEMVHGFSDTASAPMAAAEPLGLMSFSDGSPGIQSTSTTIKSLDDFQNYNQFEAFLDAAENRELSFSEGTAAVEVKYPRSITETLHIHKDFFSAPGIETKELREVGDNYLRIVAKETAPHKTGPERLRYTRFSVLREDVAGSEYLASEVRVRLVVFRGSEISVTPQGHLHTIRRIGEEGFAAPSARIAFKDVEIIQNIEYHFPESMTHPSYGGPCPQEYVKELETLFLKTPSHAPCQDQFTFFLSKMAEKQAKSSHYRFLPPIMLSKTPSGDLTEPPVSRASKQAALWLAILPYGEYVSLTLELINEQLFERPIYQEFRITQAGILIGFHEESRRHYPAVFTSQVRNADNFYTPTLDEKGEPIRALVKNAGVKVHRRRGYLQDRGDYLRIAMSLLPLPEDTTALLEGLSEEEQALLMDIQPMPYTIHRDYGFTINNIPYYFDGTIDSGGSW